MYELMKYKEKRKLTFTQFSQQPPSSSYCFTESKNPHQNSRVDKRTNSGVKRVDSNPAYLVTRCVILSKSLNNRPLENQNTKMLSNLTAKYLKYFSLKSHFGVKVTFTWGFIYLFILIKHFN